MDNISMCNASNSAWWGTYYTIIPYALNVTHTASSATIKFNV